MDRPCQPLRTARSHIFTLFAALWLRFAYPSGSRLSHLSSTPVWPLLAAPLRIDSRPLVTSMTSAPGGMARFVAGRLGLGCVLAPAPALALALLPWARSASSSRLFFACSAAFAAASPSCRLRSAAALLPLPLGAPAAPASGPCLRPGLVLVTWGGRLCSFSAMACLLLLAAPPALCPAKESRHEHMALWIYLNQGEEVNERAKQNTRKADKQDILTLHPCRPSSCELASISASPLGSYRGLAARSRTSSGESRSHARAGQSRESGTQAARDPRGDAAHENGRRARRGRRTVGEASSAHGRPLCVIGAYQRAERIFYAMEFLAPREHSSCN